MSTPCTSVKRICRPLKKYVSLLWSIPKQMENCRVNVVVGVDRVDCFISKLIGIADYLSALNTGACHPDGQRSRIVIPSDTTLRDRHASELGNAK